MQHLSPFTLHPSRSSGFTLFELVLVIFLIGILSFTAVPLLLSTKLASLDGASKKVESDLQYTQSLATTRGESYGLRTTESATNSTYEVYRASDSSIVTSPYHHGSMQENLANDYGTVAITSGFDVTFDQNGLPTFVTGSSPITLQTPDHETKTISINTSGLIRRQ